MAAIRTALAWKQEARTIPVFDFRMSKAAATINFAILQQENFNLQRILSNDDRSPLMPGSEFRPVSLLRPLWGGHPLWPRMKTSVSRGAPLELEQISDNDRLSLLATALTYGNHKSASLYGPILLPALTKEVEKGWHLPLPIDKLFEIPGIVVGPMGAVPQRTFDALGNPSEKLRMTHDQSFDYDNEDGIKSVNQRVLPQSLSECVYGHAIHRLAHATIALRWYYPTHRILVCKLDYKSAFRRLHLQAQAALQSTVTTLGLSDDPIALASLRVTFGGRPSPSLFAEISEPIADLANAIARCALWDPGELRPAHSNLIGATKWEHANVPLAPARKLIVDPQIDACGLVDVFIDDIISVFPALSERHVQKCSQAALLALDAASRPVLPNEPLPRDPMLATDKALAEGTPAEVQIILGWRLDTRRLLISLPDDKHTAWTRDITAILTAAAHNKRVKHKDLEALLGRLQHTASILSEGKHFLNRIRAAEMRAKAHGATRLNVETRRDLEYWRTLLDRANNGIDLNLLVHRSPDHIIRTDACEEGLGGFSLTTGRAWRWTIPAEARHEKSINYLEFLACIAGILISLFEGDGDTGDCFLSLGDNTSSLGWLRKSNFAADTEQASHSALARNFATTMADHGVCHFSQWFPGKENDAADILSRDQSTRDNTLSKYIKFLYSHQVSPTFRISPLPPEVTSWLDFWARHRPESTQSPPILTKRGTSTFGTGTRSSPDATSEATSSSTDFAATTGTNSSGRSSTRCATASTPRVQRAMIRWLRAHAKPPSQAYARPSATRADPIHRSTLTKRLQSFYGTRSEDTPTSIHPNDSKKRSRSSCSKK